MTTPPGWDEAYAEGVLSPWDIGRPEPAFAQLADRGLLGGRFSIASARSWLATTTNQPTARQTA